MLETALEKPVPDNGMKPESKSKPSCLHPYLRRRFQVLHELTQPTYSIALYIMSNPSDYSNILNTFPVLAQLLLKQVPNYDQNDMYLELGPMANIMEVFPSTPLSEQAIGLNILNTSGTATNLQLPQGQPYSISGPKYLIENGDLAIIIATPVLVPNVTANFSFGFPNGTFPLQCPPNISNLCFKEIGSTGYGSKFWGLVNAIVYYEPFVSGENGALTPLRRQGYSYQLIQSSKSLPPTPGLTDSKGLPATVIASNGHLAADPVSVVINLTSAAEFEPWTLLVTSGSSWSPPWEAGVLAAVVVLAAIISILTFVLLLYMRQHQRLLHALLPKTTHSSIFEPGVIESILGDHSMGSGGKLLQSGSPVERLMELLNLLVRGTSPELSEVVSLRAAFMNGGALIFQPQDLKSQLKRAYNLKDDEIDALIGEVQGFSPSADTSQAKTQGRSRYGKSGSQNNLKSSNSTSDLIISEVVRDPAAAAAASDHEQVPGRAHPLEVVNSGAEREGSITWALNLFMLSGRVITAVGQEGPASLDGTLLTDDHHKTGQLEAVAAAGLDDVQLLGLPPKMATSAMLLNVEDGKGCSSPVLNVEEEKDCSSPVELRSSAMAAVSVAHAPSNTMDRSSSVFSTTTLLYTDTATSQSLLLSPSNSFHHQSAHQSSKGSSVHTSRRRSQQPLPQQRLIQGNGTHGMIGGSGKAHHYHHQHPHSGGWPTGGGVTNSSAAHESFNNRLAATTSLSTSLFHREESNRISAPAIGPATLLQMGHQGDNNNISPPIIEPVVKLLEAAYGSWSFDAFELSELTGGHPLSSLLYFLVARSGLIKTLELNARKLARLCLAIEEGYNPNPYHNKTHAADVLQAMHTILISTGMAVLDSAPAVAGDNGSSPKCYCGPLVMLACLLAAASHDLGHKGVTNDFLINNDDELALLYSDKSPMEHYHLALLFKMLRTDHLNVLSQLCRTDRMKVRKVIIDLVSATDMKNHFAIFTQFSTAHQVVDGSPVSQGLYGHSEVETAQNRSDLMRRPKDDAEQTVSLQVALKCADLINIARPLEVTLKWVEALEQEFFEQGDRERELGLPISPLFDRNKPGVTKSQVGFYDFMVFPLFHNFACVFPGARPMVDMARSNYKYWKPSAPP
ncbi:hypothetical protein CEUSTIGMA_g10439.t1 [Chlamydomonas eustigma]|uniref:Phosphodiesterase n=1 Tax=Chlamydomonas eustigma TaxID=1157962 RepID=A0A250XJB9_9CHLO|nr:hypothetical protein CEUSTIGMA_g10439.t1 [Chlamydomonas eustigma]|eukprot:GAX83012.1 hypothetical protein CEUSTIGMA_g10439.t1 [Chlamydomonas eustigma]